MEIVELDRNAALLLAEAATRAVAEGKTFRVSTGLYMHGEALKFKVGEGMWSPPFYSKDN